MKPINVLSLFDGKYTITSEGEVFSNVGTTKKLKGKITNEGYHMVVLTVDGKKLYSNVHRLVAESFVLNPLSLPEVNHKDGCKTNNKLENLEWCTSSYNQIHARDNGLQKYKITMEDASKIRKMYETGNFSHKSLGLIFGIKKTQVGYIIQNKRWSI